jgi:predicted dehydrogenase
MAATFNWGIIGAGKIARKFAKDLATIPNARLWAIASRSAERAQTFAKEWDVPHAFDTHEEIVHCPDLHAIYIATPHHQHAEKTIHCLQHQIPVLCEKAFGMNEVEVQKMIDAAQTHQTFLMEALWTRFLPVTMQTLQWLEQGLIGDLISVKADFGFKAPFDPDRRLFNPQLGGGALLDIGIYPVFLALLTLGVPDQIQATASFASTGVDTDNGILFQYNNGQQAHLHSSFSLTSNCEAFLYGTEGTIYIHPRWHESKELTVTFYKNDKIQSWKDKAPYIGYRYETQHVMECVQAGKTESPVWSLNDSLDLIRLLDQIRHLSNIKYPQD